MAFCEACGREIPAGERLCPQCRQAAGADPEQGPPESARPGAETPRTTSEQPARAGAGDGPVRPAGAGGGAKAPGRPALLVMGGLLAAFLLFFAAAVLFGGSGGGAASGPSHPLSAWQGAEGEPAPAADPGPDSLQMAAPDAQDVLDHTPPADPLAGHSYQVVVADVTWQEAYDRAAAAGGHLATITSQAEYEAVCAAADQAAASAEVRYLWLGARRGSAGWTGSDCWITGEDWSFEAWYPGEPSGQDEDGTQEDVLCLWNVEHSGWTFNDQRNDLIAALPTVSGHVGYVIEFEAAP